MTATRKRWLAGGLAVILIGLLVAIGTFLPSRRGPIALVEALGTLEGGAEAFRQLEGVTDPATLQALIQGLSHPASRVRRMCLRLLAHIDAPETNAPVHQCLDDPDGSVRMQAALTIVQTGDPGEILAEVRAPTCPIAHREALTRALATEQVEGVNDLLLTWVADTGQDVRLRAWSATQVGLDVRLAKGPGEKALATLDRIAADPSEPIDLRASCLYAIGRIGKLGATSRLLSVLDDPKQPGRLKEGAISGLGTIQDPRANPTLTRLLQDHSLPSSFRIRALEALISQEGANSAEATLGLLHACLQDSNSALREKTVIHLRHRKTQASLPFLRQAQMTETDECIQRDLVLMVRALERRAAAAK